MLWWSSSSYSSNVAFLTDPEILLWCMCTCEGNRVMPINANIEAILLSRCCYNALTDVYLSTLVSLVSAENPKFEAISESGTCPLKWTKWHSLSTSVCYFTYLFEGDRGSHFWKLTINTVTLLSKACPVADKIRSCHPASPAGNPETAQLLHFYTLQ